MSGLLEAVAVVSDTMRVECSEGKCDVRVRTEGRSAKFWVFIGDSALLFP